MEIRCGIKKLGEREKKYVHMLNSTLCATGRAICCLLENYQVLCGIVHNLRVVYDLTDPMLVRLADRKLMVSESQMCWCPSWEASLSCLS
jgi:hypothetical protein